MEFETKNLEVKKFIPEYISVMYEAWGKDKEVGKYLPGFRVDWDLEGFTNYIIGTYKDDYYDRIYRFKSDNLWTDPSLILQSGDDIKVYVDEKDYSCYHVDIESIFNGKIIDYT